MDERVYITIGQAIQHGRASPHHYTTTESTWTSESTSVQDTGCATDADRGAS